MQKIFNLLIASHNGADAIFRTRGQYRYDRSAPFKTKKFTFVIPRNMSTRDVNDILLEDSKAIHPVIIVHNNKNQGWKHYVSFPISVGLSTVADVTAQKF